MFSWDKHNLDSDESKYLDLLESLKKNPEIRNYVTSSVMDKTVDDRTVKKIMGVLSEKYEKSKAEKCLDLVNKNISFSVDSLF